MASCLLPAGFLAGFLLASFWFPCWLPAGFLLLSCWFPAGFLLVSLLVSLLASWFPAGFLLVSSWFPAGFLFLSCWLPAGFLLVSCWFPAITEMWRCRLECRSGDGQNVRQILCFAGLYQKFEAYLGPRSGSPP